MHDTDWKSTLCRQRVKWYVSIVPCLQPAPVDLDSHNNASVNPKHVLHVSINTSVKDLAWLNFGHGTNGLAMV
jgi:hypothetical protein